MLHIVSFFLFFFCYLLYGNVESKLHYCRNDCQFPLKFDELFRIPPNIYCPRVLDDVCNVILLFDYTKQTYTVTFLATSTDDQQTDERIVYTEVIDIVKNSIQLSVATSCLYDDDCDYTHADAQIPRMTRWRYNGKSIGSKLRSVTGGSGPVDWCHDKDGTTRRCLLNERGSCLIQVDNLNKTVSQSCSGVDGATIRIIDNVGYPNISKNRQSSATYRCTNDYCNTLQTIDEVNKILLEFDLRNADGTLAKNETPVNDGASYWQVSKWTTLGSSVLIMIFISIDVFDHFA